MSDTLRSVLPTLPSRLSWASRRWYDLQFRLHDLGGVVMGTLIGLSAAAIVGASVVAILAKSFPVALIAFVIPFAIVIALNFAVLTTQEIAPAGLIDAAFRRVGADSADALRDRLAGRASNAPMSRATVANVTREVIDELGPRARRRQAREAALWSAQRDAISLP